MNAKNVSQAGVSSILLQHIWWCHIGHIQVVNNQLMSQYLSEMPPAIYHLPETAAALLTDCILLENGYVRYKAIFTHIAILGAPCVAMDHYGDVITNAMASQTTDVSSVCSTVGSGAVQRKHQSSSLLAFVRTIYRWPVNSLSQRAGNAENVSIWISHHDVDE